MTDSDEISRRRWLSQGLDLRLDRDQRPAWVSDLPTFKDVAGLGAERMLIDIPIGLPDTGYRACDLAARGLLGPVRSRAFLGIRRGLIRHTKDFATASKWARKNGKGISIQTFNILGKVGEVDALMTPQRQESIREMHPELVFLRLNRFRPVASKKTEAGLRRRRALLKENGFDALAQWQRKLHGTGAKEDDLLDACAGALAAMNPTAVECEAQTDAKGLRMEILY